MFQCGGIVKHGWKMTRKKEIQPKKAAKTFVRWIYSAPVCAVSLLTKKQQAELMVLIGLLEYRWTFVSPNSHITASLYYCTACMQQSVLACLAFPQYQSRKLLMWDMLPLCSWNGYKRRQPCNTVAMSFTAKHNA